MSRDVKKLQERIPFTKAADIEKSMVAKHGAAETYGPGTFGVEFEAEVPVASIDEMDDMISNADADDIAHIIERHGDNRRFKDDYLDWLTDTRAQDNRYGRRWDDSHGPIDVDSWLDNNPEPERRDYEDESDYDKDWDTWAKTKDGIEDEYLWWERRDQDGYVGEFVQYLIRTFNGGVYRYIEASDLFGLLYPGTSNGTEQQSELITTVREWLVGQGEKVSDDEQGHKDEWGVGTDGDNIEIRTKHMRNEDVETLVELMNWMRRNHFIVSGGTSAHVHVGLPADFDYFDLLVTVTLVDEDKVKTDAGPDREFRNWARLRDQIIPHIFLQVKRWSKDGGDTVTLSEKEMGDFLRQTFQKFQGTNISSFFHRKTVEFRYFSSKMIANPPLFIQWIKYFMLLPAVAKKRSRATFIHPDNAKMKLVAVRKQDGSVTLSIGGRVADVGEKPSDLKGGRPSPDHPAFDDTTFDAKEQAVKKHLDRLLKKAHARTISAREEQLLSRLKDEWQKILDKKPVKI